MKIANRQVVTFYDKATGAITGWSGKNLDCVKCDDAHGWIEGRHEGRIDPDTLEAVPLLQFDVTVEDGRVSGIPEGTEVLVLGEKPPIKDGAVEIEVEFEETIGVLLNNPIYEPITVPVPCTPGKRGKGAVKRKVRDGYRRMRRVNYPSNGDQNDAMIKAIRLIADHIGIELPDEVTSVFDAVTETKTKFPKRSDVK